jgi:hypothetical protein
MSETSTNQENGERILWSDFLECVPPGSPTQIQDLCHLVWGGSGNVAVVSTPDLQLYCASDSCRGVRFFSCEDGPGRINDGSHFFLVYTCRNCRKHKKTFAVIAASQANNALGGTAVKLGELPAFGPPVPPRVIALIGPDRDLFLRGRRAENQGLGVGAFAYYRRVVENQKNRLIGEIAKAAKRLGASPEVLNQFETAIKETQFSKAVDDIRTAIPQALLIDNHNPLMLLHRALSDGLHDRTDEECLELATGIRVVLTELSERISQALKDDAELRSAVGRLMRPTKKPPEPGEPTPPVA